MKHESLPYLRVSPKLATLRQIVNALTFSVLVVVSTVGVALLRVLVPAFERNTLGAVLFVVPVGFLVWGVVRAIIIGRQVRALGYLENRDDLLLRRGILFRQQVAVPYGRIQYVDIQQGPLQRSFGITTIVITTAGGGNAATFDGLPMAEAERLREELVERGYERLAELGAS